MAAAVAENGRRHPDPRAMRLLYVYLIAYFALVVGAVLALWQAGVLGQLPAEMVAIGLLVAIGLGPPAATSLD
jgi:hypothetical protein